MGRRRALLALLGLVGMAGVSLVVVAGGDVAPQTVDVSTGTTLGDAASEPTTSEAPSTTEPAPAPTSAPSTTTASPRPTTTARPAAPTTTRPPEVRRRLLDDGAGAWVLDAVSAGATSCVELVLTGGQAKRVLCDAPPADGLVGDVASFRTGERSWAVVAVVGSGVSGLGLLHTPASAAATFDLDGTAVADPLRPGYAYSVWTSTSSGAPTWMFLFDGHHVLGRVTLPPSEVFVRRADLDLATGSPYGRWPGYRFASYTGLIWGGHQELGFYDGPGGETCVLYRRLGDGDRVFADTCPAKVAGGGIAAAIVAWDGPRSQAYQPVLIVDGAMTAWRCADGCGVARPMVVADPAGTGRSVGVLFASATGPGVVMVALDGEREIGRASAPPPEPPPG